MEGTRLALDEMRRNLDRRHEADDLLDQKLMTLMQTAGAVLALLAAVQLTLGRPLSADWRAFLLGVAIGLYFVLVLATVYAINPARYWLPIAADWDELASQLMVRTEEEAMQKMISSYIEVIDRNKMATERKALVLRWGLFLLPVNAALLLLLNLPL